MLRSYWSLVARLPRVRRGGSRVRWALAAALILALLATAVPLSAQSTPKESTQLSFDLDVRQAMDNDRTNAVSELSPTLTFRQERKRGFWELRYQPSLRYFVNRPTRDRLDHHVDFDTNLRLSKRWNLDFGTSFLKSTNPFLRVAQETGGKTTPGDVLFSPNRGFVGPERSFTTLRSNLTFSYLLSPHSQLSFGADYYRERERATRQLDQEARNLRVQYSKQYARNKGLGAMYSHQQFRASVGNQRVRTHSLIFHHSYEFRPGSTLSVFGGPQYSFIRAEPTVSINFFFFQVEIGLRVREPVYNVAWGGLFTQRLNEHTWMDVSVSQRVSEGGGFTGTVRQRSARLSLSRELSRRLSVSLSGYATDNRVLGGLVGRNLRTYGFSTGFGWRLSRRMDLRGQYDFSRFGSGAGELQSLLSRNRVSVGIHYSVGTLALGR